MATVDQARVRLERLCRKIQARANDYEELRDAYEGAQRLAFASEEFQKHIGSRYQGFCDNWVRPVAEAPTERLKLIGLQLDPTVDGVSHDREALELERVWRANGCDADFGLALLDSIVCSRAYGLVWGNDDDPDTPEISFESPTEAIVEYAPGSRRKRAAAAKMWRDDDFEYAVLWLPDEKWRFHRPSPRPDQLYDTRRSEMAPHLAGGWVLSETDDGHPNPQPNPLGVVPLVEMPNRPLLSREPLSDVSGVLAMQKAINLMWAQLFVASDFASLTQRILLGVEKPRTPILDDKGQVVGHREIPVEDFLKSRFLMFKDPEAKTTEWTAADLEVWTKVITLQVGHVAGQTRTPPHYLVQGQIANVSADGLKAAETGLAKRSEEKTLYSGQGALELRRLVALAQGKKELAKAVSTGSMRWADVENRSDAQLVDSLLKMRQLGFPFQWICERYGLGQTEINRIVDMLEAEKNGAAARLLGGDLETVFGAKRIDLGGAPPQGPAAVDDGQQQLALEDAARS